MMPVEPLIGGDRYHWLKRFRSMNQTGAVTKDGICLFEGPDCIYTVGFREHGMDERIFICFKTGKGHKSDMHALLQGLKQHLTVEAMRNNRAELKLGENRYYVIGEEQMAGGTTNLTLSHHFLPEIYGDEGRPSVTYFPATRPQVPGW